MMKVKCSKIIISVIAIVTFVFVCFLCLTSDSAKIAAYFNSFVFSSEFNNNLPLSDYYYKRLNDTEKKAYICILDNIDSHPEYIRIPKLTGEEFNNVYFAVKNDNPHMLCFSDSCNMITFLSGALVELNYSYTADECRGMHDEMMEQVRIIIENMPDYSDDFSKELYIHDYIVSSCVYGESESSSNAYGCIIEKKAVCSGYSRAAMVLLKHAGVESVIIGGTGVSPSQGNISHMWNIVWIEDKPYHLDVTWDDSERDESTSHLYFNLCDNAISLDHTDFSFSFVCDSDKHNYFRYNGLYFTSYGNSELDVIQNKLLENIRNGMSYIEIAFDSQEAFKLAEDSMINRVEPGTDMYKIISSISSETGDVVDVSHVNFSSDKNKKYIRLMFDWN